MAHRHVLLALTASAAVAAAGCGSSSSHRTTSGASAPTLGGPAPAQLTGTFTTTLNRQDRAGAPKPDEWPIGPWTLVIGHHAGPNNARALGVGNGDTNRVVYRFGVSGNVLSIRCNDAPGLPSTGAESHAWTVRG